MSKLKTKALYNPAFLANMEGIFLLSFEVLLIIRMINIYSLLPSIIDTALFSLVTLIGLIVLCGNIVQWFRLRKRPHILLIFYIIALTISSLINGPTNLIANAKVVFWQVLYLFVVFNIGEQQNNKLFKMFSKILIYAWNCLVSVSLIMFLIQFTYVQPLGKFYNGLRVGFVENRLYGIFSDPNFAAVISVVVIFLLIWNSILRHQQELSSKLSNLFVVLNFLYVVLSGSRTAEIALFIVTITGVFFYLYNKGNHTFLLISKYILYALLSGAACLMLFASTQKIVPFITTEIKSFVQIDVTQHNKTKPDVSRDKEENISLDRSDVDGKEDVSNNRFKLWKSSIEIFKAAPLFGTSTRNFVPFAQKNVPRTFIASKRQTSHNFIFYLLATSGLFGTLPIVIFIVYAFLLALKKLFMSSNQNVNYLFNFLLALTILISGMFLTEIVLVNKIGALVFWLCLGYLFGQRYEGEFLNEKDVHN